MNSWELFEAMTDLEDDTILAAAPTLGHDLRPLSQFVLLVVHL